MRNRWCCLLCTGAQWTLGLLLLTGAPPAAAQVAELVQLLEEGTGLDIVRALAGSPDDQNVYTVTGGPFGEAAVLSVFRRDASSGDLEFVEIHRGGIGELRELEGAAEVVVTPDGGQVLVLDTTDPMLFTFDRSGDGSLTFAASHDLGTVGHEQLWSMALSPDGSSLYFASSSDTALLHYARDPASGAVRLVAVHPVEIPGADRGPLRSLRASRDGRNVYARGIGVIVTLGRDPATGGLSTVSITETPSGATDLLLTPDGRWVLTVSDELHRFARDPGTGSLTADGFVRVQGASLALPPDGGHVYVCDPVEAGIHVLFWNDASGELSLQGTFEPFDDTGDGHLICHASILMTSDGRHLHLLAEIGIRDTLLHLVREPGSGELTFAGSLDDGEGGPGPFAGGRAAVTSPAGDHVYATFTDGISVFRRDREGNGSLARLQTVRNNVGGVQGLAGVQDLALSPDGENLYAVTPEAGPQGAAVTVFRRDPATGLLDFVEGLVDGLEGPGCCVGGERVLVSPEGKNVYTLSGGQASLGVYGVSDDGRLEPLDVLTHGVAGVGGLAAPSDMTLTPDGRDLYVTSDEALLVRFRREGSTGLLAGRDLPVTDLCPHAFFTGGVTVATSTDGRQVHVTTDPEGGGDDLTLSFTRDPATGALSGLACFSGTETPQLVLSPDGRYGFGTTTAGFVVPTIREFVREEDGTLVPAQRMGFPFETPGPPTVSPDGLNVYVPAAEGLAAYRLPSIASEEFPGFRFRVELGRRFDEPLDGRAVTGCLPETLCVAGALPNRTELLARIAGPKPNGRLWPFVIKASTSPVDLWIAQLATGELRRYHLPGATPGSSVLPGLFDRRGFPPLPATDAAPSYPATEPPPPPPDEPPFTTDAFPDFRLWVRITVGGAELPVRLEPACIPETVCWSGAIPGRAEVLFRIVGPKPNGFLWPTVMRLTTSSVELWVQRISTGELRHYRLPGATPGDDRLDGLFDRFGFSADGS